MAKTLEKSRDGKVLSFFNGLPSTHRRRSHVRGAAEGFYPVGFNMSSPRIVLSGIGPKLEGLQWESESGLRIGRQGNVDVVLRDFSVDRLQAETRLAGSRWVICDLSQSDTFPTLVNGKRLGRGEQPLNLEDVLQFGKLHLKVTALDLAGQPRTAPPAANPPGGEPSKANGQEVNGHSTVQSGVNGHAGGTGAVAALPEHAPPSPAVTVPRPAAFGNQEAIRTSGAFVKVQARTHQSWDQALEQVAVFSDPTHQQGRALLTLLRANHHLVHIASLEDLVGSILKDVIGALGAQHGTIALFDETSGKLVLKAHQAPGIIQNCQWNYSKTLAERSFRVGESLLCRDVNADDDLLLARSVRQGAMASIICALLRTPRKRIGVLQLDSSAFQEPFTENDLYLVDAIAATAAIGIESAQLVELQREQFIQTVTTLARAVEMRDQCTGDHTKRVTDYALMLADELKLSPVERYQIQIGTPLHDIGKIGIDDAILRKPGKLTAGEFECMKTHTTKGAAMLDSIGSLGPMIPIVRHHHERWDGTGYPDRIGQKNIALIARIVAVADAFDAMTSDRPYRPALPGEHAFLELLKQAGTHFDPDCVQAFGHAARSSSYCEAVECDQKKGPALECLGPAPFSDRHRASFAQVEKETT